MGLYGLLQFYHWKCIMNQTAMLQKHFTKQSWGGGGFGPQPHLGGKRFGFESTVRVNVC